MGNIYFPERERERERETERETTISFIHADWRKLVTIESRACGRYIIFFPLP